jgi:hypothetical protein
VKIFVFLLFYSFSILAEINHENHDFSFEYGLGYHTLRGVQKENNSKGTLTSSQNPYWLGSYTIRLGSNLGLKVFGGFHVVRFNEPKYGTLKNEDQLLNQFGLELIKKLSAIDKLGFFFMQQDHPLYYAKTPTDFEVVKKAFVQAGVHYSIGQRRRIGLLWGLGAKAYTIFPAKGGDVATEAGVGGEAYARFGWADNYGTLYQFKGIYQATTAPNSNVQFTHEFLGYALQVSHTL